MDPTPNYSFNIVDDDDATIVTSNCTRTTSTTNVSRRLVCAPNIVATARMLLGTPSPEQLNALTIASTHAIADTGATSIFIMDNADVVNKKIATRPLTINLPDGRRVMSTHTCDTVIPGLPSVIIGHVMPHLAVASLIGIRPLCKAGCTVTFDDDKCDVNYDGNDITRFKGCYFGFVDATYKPRCCADRPSMIGP